MSFPGCILSSRKLRWRLLVLLVVASVSVASAPSPIVPPAEAQTVVKRAAAWIPYWDQARAYQSFLANADLIGEVSPMWYEMTSASAIARYPNAEDPSVSSGIRSKGALLMPTVTNGFDPDRVSAMLATQTSRTAHVNALVSLARSKYYDGLDIDYEMLNAADRDRYSSFIRQLAATMHAYGKVLSVAVQPKTSEPGHWSGVQALDYAAIGAAADRLRVMAYDYHWNTSPAGPIAPRAWVDEVARFAASRVVPSKVQLGLGLYGYDWVGSNGEALTFDLVMSRMKANGASRNWSSVDAEPWYTYTANGAFHEVWYADSASVGARLPSVDAYGLRGPVFWRLGGEDPAVWTQVRSRWGGADQGADDGSGSGGTEDVTAPTTPAGLNAVGGWRSVSLTWSGSTDAGGSGLAGYEVFRASSSAGPFTKVAAVTATSYNDRSLRRRTGYWYYVKAYDAAGNRSAPTATVSAITR